MIKNHELFLVIINKPLSAADFHVRDQERAAVALPIPTEEETGVEATAMMIP